jgi:hypothetical protein
MERLLGAILGLVTGLVLFIAGLFSFGSLWRYRKLNKM